MKRLKTVLGAGASLFAMATSAYAEPISLTAALLFSGSALGSISISPIITAIATVALSIGAALLARQSAPTVAPEEYKSVFAAGTEISEIRAGGRVLLGGLKAFGNTSGFERFRWIWHAKGPLVAIEAHYLGGIEVTVEPDGLVSSPPYATPGGSYVSVRSKNGLGDETAWSDLVSYFPDLITSDHIGKGIAQTLAWYTSPGVGTDKFLTIYQSGEPDYSHLARYGVVYDPRDEAQDPDDQSTWQWSENGILWAAAIALDYPDLTPAMFDWDLIATSADTADVLLYNASGGVEERSRFGGVWQSETKRGDTLQQVLDSVGAELVMTDEGKIWFRHLVDSPTSEITFSAAQDQVEFSWQSGPEAVERPNVCIVKYYSPELNYEIGEIDMTGIAWARIENEITRYGEKPMTIELSFCPSASQAQRIARRLFLLARADTGVIKTNMAGLAAWGLTYATIEDADAEEEMLCKILPPRVNDAAGTVEIPYIVWPDLPEWDPEVDEALPPEQVPPIQYVSEVETPAAPVEATLVKYTDDTYEQRVLFAGVDGGTQVEAVYRKYVGDDPDPYQSMTEYQGATTAYYAYDAEYTEGERVDFKVRFFNDEDEASSYSDIFTVDPMAIDNVEPSPPSFSVNKTVDGSLTTYACTVECLQMKVVRLKIERESLTPGVWFELLDEEYARPEVIYSAGTSETSGVDDITVNLRAIAYTSDGTASEPALYSDTIIGTGP